MLTVRYFAFSCLNRRAAFLAGFIPKNIYVLIILLGCLISLPAKAQVNNVKIKNPKGTVQAPQPGDEQITRIQILGADLYEFSEVGGRQIKTLSGNVQLQQEKVFMYCDKANLSDDDNTLDATGHVKIIQDTVRITSDSLHYDGIQKKSHFVKNVTLSDSKMKLTTQQLDYDMQTRVANYQTGAVITNDSTTLVSQTGYYYANTDDVYFKHNVKLNSPKYNLTADTLRFNSQSKISYFLGPTNITSDSTKIYCEGGYYNTDKNIANFTNHARMDNPHQFLKADSIYYDKNNRIGIAQNNIFWLDSIQHISIEGNYARYNDKVHYIMVTNHPLLTNMVDDDSMYLTADTVKSTEDTLTHKRIFYGYHKVKIFKSNLQALCDSLTYTDVDSTFRLFHNPVVWMEANQMKADTILLLLQNKNVKEIRLLKTAFVSSKADSLLFNQMKGKNMYGYFENGEMKRLQVDGNGQSVYYAKDDSGAFIGVNKIVCSNMLIYLDSSQVKKIKFNVKPEGAFYPLRQAPHDEVVLKDFIWMEAKKPKSKKDLLD